MNAAKRFNVALCRIAALELAGWLLRMMLRLEQQSQDPAERWAALKRGLRSICTRVPPAP